jgi:hypothetical protein
MSCQHTTSICALCVKESWYSRPSSRHQLLARHLYWYLRQTKRKRLSHALSVVPSSTHASARRLFGDTVFGVEAVLEVLAVLVRGVVGEHLAAGCALERLEARLALDRLGGGVLHAGVSTATGLKGRGACVQPSAGSWPPWDQRRPCGRASAVLCERRQWWGDVGAAGAVLRSVAHGVGCWMSVARTCEDSYRV